MQREICKIYEMIDVDNRVKCVVITGAGPRAFCAGADLEIGFLGGAGKDGSPVNAKSERDVDHRDG